VGIDIGGTFTDIVLITSDGATHTRKVPSTPSDYSRAVIAGLAELLADVAKQGIAPHSIDDLLHASTVATNAVLAKHGAKTALITTRGFRDVLEIRRLRIPQLYNIGWDKPEPLISRALRFEVPERIDARGAILEPLDEQRVRDIAGELRAQSIESVAVCLLNSYSNPSHERRIKELLEEELGDIPTSISSDILREIGEYERTSTTVINAYVAPVVAGYLDALEAGSRALGILGRLLIMQSNGAVMTIAAAKQRPCFLVESGPAAGVTGGQVLAERIGERNVITFDMGGTTAKASLLEDGQISFTDEYETGAGLTVSSRLMKGDGYLLRIPAIDLAEVGAGGGSVAWLDDGGVLQVGPRSVGADPGPACYDRGNHEPTVTDANVVLGYINPHILAGGAFTIKPERSWESLEQLGHALDMSPMEAAYAVHVISNARMSRAIRAVSTARGRDVREFALLTFGGSGPIHAVHLARSLGMRRVIVPPHPGLFSAFGLLFAASGHQFVQSFRLPLEAGHDDTLLAAVDDVQRSAVIELAALGYDTAQLTFTIAADVRYVGQFFRLRIELPKTLSDPNHSRAANLFERFEVEHARRYGHRAEGEAAEIVSLHLTAQAGDPHGQRSLLGQTVTSNEHTAATAPRTRRPMYSSREVGLVDAPMLSRDDLADAIRGPAIIEEYDTTIIIPAGYRAMTDAQGNVLIDLEG
jgi:N-methylhydantoinase A